MPTNIWGVVREGVVVPSVPLPEGAHVQIQLSTTMADLPPDLRAELEAWQGASAEALNLVERLAQENEPHEAS